MNIVSAASDGGRIHMLTRAALASIPDGPERFWRHLCDALRGAMLLENELGKGASIYDVQRIEGGGSTNVANLRTSILGFADMDSGGGQKNPTRNGCYLERRFCKQLSESFPC